MYPLNYCTACSGLIMTSTSGSTLFWRNARKLPDGREPQILGHRLACLPASWGGWLPRVPTCGLGAPLADWLCAEPGQSTRRRVSDGRGGRARPHPARRGLRPVAHAERPAEDVHRNTRLSLGTAGSPSRG